MHLFQENIFPNSFLGFFLLPEDRILMTSSFYLNFALAGEVNAETEMNICALVSWLDTFFSKVCATLLQFLGSPK